MPTPCEERFDCCDCGGADCGCHGCFSCNACDECLHGEEEEECDRVKNNEKYE